MATEGPSLPSGALHPLLGPLIEGGREGTGGLPGGRKGSRGAAAIEQGWLFIGFFNKKKRRK